MRVRRLMRGGAIAVLLVTLTAAGVVRAERDARADALAESVLEAMGGREAWNATRHVSWRFFGGRLHHWDRHAGAIRLDSPERVEEGKIVSPAFTILMNIHTRQGRAWEAGQPVEDAAELETYLGRGHEMWVNDSYWMFMPYKLLDPGVRLRSIGELEMADGRPAEVLELTFGGDVGYTPQNRYEVFVARDSGLIEQWSFYADAGDTEPRFTMPWHGWRRFGAVMLATDHGRQRDWAIAVHDELPHAVYDDPGPVER